MDQHTRMLKTLVCLAVAMTGTAAFLHWLDPSSTLRAPTLAAHDVAVLVRSLVTDAVDIKPDQWKDVEVVAGPIGGNAGTPLTASPDSAGCHFYIDQAGRPSRARGWSRQMPPDDAPHTVRIQVARASGAGEFPTPLQWFTIRNLVEALDAALLQNGAMRVYIQGDSADAAASVYLAADLLPASR